MQSLISANPGFLEPRILLFTCSGGVSLLNELADKGFSYPANLMVLEVPCIGMVTPFIPLRAFDLGAAGLGIVTCKGKCQYGYDLNLMLENVQITSKLLRILGIGPERVCAIIPDGNDTLAFYTQLKTFTEKIMQMDIQPLRGKKPSELKNLENPLSSLVRQIVGKLNINKNIQFQDAKLPFGIVEVDAKECSMCGLCASHCPTNAINLKKEMELVKLLFNYNLCITCGICLKRCPRKAMRIEKLLDLKRFEQPISILMESKTVKCQLCNIAFSPDKQIEVVSSRFPDKPSNYFQLISKYCPNCRLKALLKNVKEVQKLTPEREKRD